MGGNISDNRADSSIAWIWWNRRGIGRNCQVLICSVFGDVRYLLFLRLERKKSSISNGCLIQSWEVPMAGSENLAAAG